ncbi:MAG: hypothetical protein JWM80_6011 [Cyanobacteria bacterium RYN_339]|nr:hypothetical protein [Cyanobacteria bacterium RYN_339]
MAIALFEGWPIAAQVAQRPGKVFLDGPTSLTYGELATRMARIGAWCEAVGLAPGSRVVVAVASDEAALPIILGLLRYGRVPLIASHEATRAELADLFAWVEPEGAILDQTLATDLAWGEAGKPLLAVGQPVGSLLGKLFRRRTAGGTSYPDAVADLPAAPAPPVPASDQLAYVLFTSGSTSRPKGVEITHGALTAHLQTFVQRFGYGPDTRLLNVLHLFHTDGLFHGPLVALAAGGTLVRPFPGSLAVERLGDLEDALFARTPTHLVTVPTMLALQLHYATAPAERPPALRMILSSAATLEPRVWAGAMARYGVPVVNIYGLTETVCGSLYAGPDEASLRVGTVGVPDGCEARIERPDGLAAAPDEPGELLLRGPHLLRGYHRNPEATAQVLQGGWLRTGDLASRDADGLYRLRGRAKHVIITGGNNVSPDEVNEVLAAHPLVREAATLGAPEPTWGEVVVSFVALDGPGDKAGEVLAYCRERLSAYKVPHRLHIVEALPRGGSGKVQMEALRGLLAELEPELPVEPATGPEIERTVYGLAARCFRVPPDMLTPTTGPRTLGGWTSLAHMEFVVALERTFGIQLGTRDIMALADLGAAVEVVRRHKGAVR